MRVSMIILLIIIGCGGDKIIEPRVKTKAEPVVQIKLGSPRQEVLNVLGEPNAIRVTEEAGTVFVYDKCTVWLDDQIVTNIFCDDIAISKKDISRKPKR